MGFHSPLIRPAISWGVNVALRGPPWVPMINIAPAGRATKRKLIFRAPTVSAATCWLQGKL